MKLIYLYGGKITSEKANLIQVISMCNGFSQQGIDVELVSAFTKQKISAPYEYLTERFNIEPAWKFSFYRKFTPFNRLNNFGGYLGLSKYLKNSVGDLYYTRSPLTFVMVAHRKLPVVFEAHNAKMHTKFSILDRYWINKVVKASKKNNVLAFITISEKLADYWQSLGVPSNKILALHDGCNSGLFKNPLSRKEARQQLALPTERKLVTYVGSLQPDREIEQIILLAERFSEALFMVVGGPDENAQCYKNIAHKQGISNISFIGPIDHHYVPHYMYASDVLLALWSDKVPTINYCSPLKIFEYMAACRLIIAHGYPTIKEVLTHNYNAILCEPNSKADLTQKVQYALSLDYPNTMADQARKDVLENYTWDKRAEKILQELNR